MREFGDGVELAGTGAGMHTLVWFGDLRTDDWPALERAALAQGLGIYPVHPCYLTPPERLGLVFQYVGPTPGQIDEGIRRLAAVCSRR